MANVYLSSTFQDLEECRRQASATLRRMGHVDVAMEHYGAEDAWPLDRCLADVAACDLVILVVAWRYGFVPDGHDRSITELEYRQALACGKPVLAFLLSEDAAWPAKHIDRVRDAVETFRDELAQARLVAKFTDAADLSRRVGEAVHQWERESGRGSSGGRADWEAYRRAVFETHSWVRLAVIAGAKQDRRFAEIPLIDVFVAQPVQAGPPEYDVPEPGPEAELRTVLAEPSLDVLGREPRQVLLGAPGSGKSTLLLHAALLLCNTGRDPATLPPGLRHAPLPFLVELRQYALDPAGGIVGYLARTGARRYGVELDAESVAAVLAEDDRAVVMFDGLDEVFDAGAQNRIVDEFRAFARRYPGARLVVTSRIAGYPAHELERDGFRHYTLRDFGMPEIREFVPRWYRHYTWQGDQRDAAGLVRRVADSPRLRELAGNPLLLTMMAVIYKHQDLPEKRWQLYARCTEVLLEDWDVKRKNIDRNVLMPLGFTMLADQKAELLQRVSMYMLEHREAGSELNAIARGPLLAILAGYLREQFHKSPGEARAVAAEILDHLRERTYIIAEIGPGRFGFVHRTFMEFFAAEHCKAEFNRREADYDWLTRDLYGTRWRQDEWREVLLLLIAMLKDQGSPVRKVVDHLLHEPVQGVRVHVAFAARCLAESGAAIDDPWARYVLARLVMEVWFHARRDHRSNSAAVSFVDDALGPFTVLAQTVSVDARARERIDELCNAEDFRARMVGFQFQLALRSRDDRLAFALGALKDPAEAVRRAAIAALEREWAGREDVYAALLKVLSEDRISRVRSAALEALERGWPPDPAILDTLGGRVAVETAYTFVIEVLEYLARRWAGNLEALDLVLEFRTARWIQGSWYCPPWRVDKAAVRAVVSGWGGTTTGESYLWNRWRQHSDLNLTAFFARVMSEGWCDDPEAAKRISIGLAEEADPVRREAMTSALLRARPTDVDLHRWARRRAVTDQDAGVRAGILAAISFDPEDADAPGWLEKRLVRDPDPSVRNIALRQRVALAQNAGTLSGLLRDRAVDDDGPGVRLFALEILAGLRKDLPFVLARTGVDAHLAVRENMARRLSERPLVDLLRERLHEHEEESSGARATVLWALAVAATTSRRRSGFRLRNLNPGRTRWHEQDHRPVVGWLLSNVKGFPAGSDPWWGGQEVREDPEFLARAADADPVPPVRAFAVVLLVTLAPRARPTRDLIRRWLDKETDPAARSVIEALVAVLPPPGAGKRPPGD